MSTLQKRIRTARKRAGLTQEKISKATGINRNTYANWELGRTSPNRNPPLQTTRKGVKWG